MAKVKSALGTVEALIALLDAEIKENFIPRSKINIVDPSVKTILSQS